MYRISESKFSNIHTWEKIYAGQHFAYTSSFLKKTTRLEPLIAAFLTPQHLVKNMELVLFN